MAPKKKPDASKTTEPKRPTLPESQLEPEKAQNPTEKAAGTTASNPEETCEPEKTPGLHPDKKAMSAHQYKLRSKTCACGTGGHVFYPLSEDDVQCSLCEQPEEIRKPEELEEPEAPAPHPNKKAIGAHRDTLRPLTCACGRVFYPLSKDELQCSLCDKFGNIDIMQKSAS